MALLSTPVPAQSTPIEYDLIFDGSGSGAPGAGSFVWDADTLSMSSFGWVLGGVSGGVTDAILAQVWFGAPNGAYAYEVLTGTDTHPYFDSGRTCFLGSALIGPFSQACFFSPTLSDPSMPGAASTYDLNNGAYRGRFTSPESVVPLPATLTLLSMGIGGLGVLAKRRRRY